MGERQRFGDGHGVGNVIIRRCRRLRGHGCNAGRGQDNEPEHSREMLEGGWLVLIHTFALLFLVSLALALHPPTVARFR